MPWVNKPVLSSSTCIKPYISSAVISAPVAWKSEMVIDDASPSSVATNCNLYSGGTTLGTISSASARTPTYASDASELIWRFIEAATCCTERNSSSNVMVVVPDRPSSSGAGTVRVILKVLLLSTVSVPKKAVVLLKPKPVNESAALGSNEWAVSAIP